MVKKIVIKIISMYKLYISALLGSHCRFHPSCSQYFQDAVSEYGVLGGMVKGTSRIIRCHPFSAGGYDPLIK